MNPRRPAPATALTCQPEVHIGFSRLTKFGGFTLIELLVCLAVLMILLALLQPVLGAAKFKSKEVVETSNMRQTAMGFISYATENNRRLPYHWYDRGDNNYIWDKVHGDHGNNWVPIAQDYDFVETTANPVTGATAWDDPGNNDPHYARETWTFFYSYRYQNSIYSSPVYTKASGTDAMFTDMVRYYRGAYYGSLHVRGWRIVSPPRNPSWTRNSAKAFPSNVKMFVTQYDGSVQSADFDELKVRTWAGGLHYYRPNQ